MLNWNHRKPNEELCTVQYWITHIKKKETGTRNLLLLVSLVHSNDYLINLCFMFYIIMCMIFIIGKLTIQGSMPCYISADEMWCIWNNFLLKEKLSELNLFNLNAGQIINNVIHTALHDSVQDLLSSSLHLHSSYIFTLSLSDTGLAEPVTIVNMQHSWKCFRWRLEWNIKYLYVIWCFKV